MRPLVKICGLKRVEDARLAAELGATHVGVVAPRARPDARACDEARAIFDAAAEARRSGARLQGGARRADRRRRGPHPARRRFSSIEFDEADAIADRVARAPRLSRLPTWTETRTVACLRSSPQPSEERPAMLDVGGGGSGRRFDWPLSARRRSAATFVAGGIDPGQRRARSLQPSSLRDRSVERRRERARREGCPRGSARCSASGGLFVTTTLDPQSWRLRRVRRALRPRAPRSGARAARAGPEGDRAAAGSSSASSRCCSPTGRDGRRRFSTTPVFLGSLRTRRRHEARGLAPRRCSQDEQRRRPGASRDASWANGASSPRPVRASTAPRRRWRRPGSGSRPSSTWARRTWSGRRRT